MNDIDQINQARTLLDHDVDYNDINLAVYIVRDLKVTKDAELSDLAWAMYLNYCTKSEALHLLDEIEKYIMETKNA